MSSREEELFRERLAKLERLRRRGIDPYPARYKRSHTSVQAAADFEAWEASPAGEAPFVTIAGRIAALRKMGRAAFLDLVDGEGRLQVFVRSDRVSATDFETLKDDLDLGDFLGVSGRLFRTKAGEITVEADSLTVLAKALQAPPEKWHGLTDVEQRYRQRYRDLMANEEVRQLFKTRSRIVSAVRRYLDGRGFMEVETPVLQPEAGGAAATPFVTHHRALDQDFYLRISLELYLKRLLVGGYEKVYEIGRIFRNEGVSWKYNPEFTMLESYEAYADYNDVARMVEEMVSSVAMEVLGKTQVQFEDHVIDLAPPWRRVTVREALIEHAGIDFLEFRTRETLYEELRRRGFTDLDPGWSLGKLIDKAREEYVEPKLIQPTFLLDYPKEISPLAKSKPGEPGIVERFEVFIAGFEIGNAYSELNDPVDQRERFEAQQRQVAAGIEEVETLDEDFLTAIEHGMPPTGGLGLGIDRLAMILTGHRSIREVILFPALRKRE
ncbi:MAG TPA: lysine--tRNA ligase [Dehalococcoidia bacterium]|nr:lysine--tRNA ligase [Dehalococcoidia bacterium]